MIMIESCVNDDCVEIKMNTKVDLDMIKADKPDAVVLATGSETLILPFIKGIHNPDIVHGMDALEGKRPVGLQYPQNIVRQTGI